MSVATNIDLLATPALSDFPGTVSARLRALEGKTAGRSVDAGWQESLAGLSAAAEGATIELEKIDHANPCASYASAKISVAGQTVAHGRLIVPEGACRPGERVPLVLMFHDAGRPIRGWHHMTRFAALGMAVLALDQGVVEASQARAAMAGLAPAALALARAALGLPFVDPMRVFAWGEGLGGGLAVLVSAALGDRVARCAAMNPLPADAPDVACHLDAAVLAQAVSAELLVGCGLRDELAPAEGQAAIAYGAAGPARIVFYPEHAHERINEFENQVLAFLASPLTASTND